MLSPKGPPPKSGTVNPKKKPKGRQPARLKLTLPETSEVIEVSPELPLLPMRDVVIFPHATLPLFVGRKQSVAALEQALSNQKILVAVTQQRPETASPGDQDLYSIGTIIRVLQLFRLPDGTTRILAQGLHRIRIEDFKREKNCSYVTVSLAEDNDELASYDLPSIAADIQETFLRYVEMNRRVAPEVGLAVRAVDDPAELSYKVAAYIQTSVLVKQRLLESKGILARLGRLKKWLDKEIISLQKLEEREASVTTEQQTGLESDLLFGDRGAAPTGGALPQNEISDELDEIAREIEEARMPKVVEDKAFRELDRLGKMSLISPEATVSRSYLEWLIQIPWHKRTRDHTGLRHVEKILDEDHFGLRKVKERILEQISVIKLSREVRGPILCLTGPPGVGKTSLGRSIARALGRKFVRMSLGGIRDESEIRGHRRTYIGSLPGRIIQAMRKAGSINPVILLDEVDKLGNDHRGDPASALLEVLDPEQNVAYNDHYLEVDYDLSQVLFITTSNLLHAIPGPLRDRMEVIRIPGYLETEKIQIAKRFLLPRQRKANGLVEKDLALTDAVYQSLVTEYTREAGVRNLEREIARICRRVAKVKAGGKDKTLSDLQNKKAQPAGKKTKTKSSKRGDISSQASSVIKSKSRRSSAGQGRTGGGRKANREPLDFLIGKPQLKGLLGPSRHSDLLFEQSSRIGMATGLAWTSVGGEILTIEVGVLPGRGNLMLTGQLGETMRESAQAALSYVRSRSEMLGLDRLFYRRVDIHVHVPEGAVPKDGPSAGVSLALAMVSALTEIPTREGIALTGEITLRGNVLPIGGLGEKIVAAKRCGIRTILLPKRNCQYIEELPKELVEDLKLHPVETVDEVLRLGLESMPKSISGRDVDDQSHLAA